MAMCDSWAVVVNTPIKQARYMCILPDKIGQLVKKQLDFEIGGVEITHHGQSSALPGRSLSSIMWNFWREKVLVKLGIWMQIVYIRWASNS